MGIKERIESMSDEWLTGNPHWDDGYERARSQAAQLAQEAESVMEEMVGALYDCKQLAVELVRSEGQDPEREDEIRRACYALDLYKEQTNEQ